MPNQLQQTRANQILDTALQNTSRAISAATDIDQHVSAAWHRSINQITPQSNQFSTLLNIIEYAVVGIQAWTERDGHNAVIRQTNPAKTGLDHDIAGALQQFGNDLAPVLDRFFPNDRLGAVLFFAVIDSVIQLELSFDAQREQLPRPYFEESWIEFFSAAYDECKSKSTPPSSRWPSMVARIVRLRLQRSGGRAV